MRDEKLINNEERLKRISEETENPQMKRAIEQRMNKISKPISK